MVYCVYSLELPRWDNSNENTQHTFILKKNRKYIPIMPPDLAQWLTLISSNYPCLEYIFMVPNVFEPLKFYCNNVSKEIRFTLSIVLFWQSMKPNNLKSVSWFSEYKRSARVYLIEYSWVLRETVICFTALQKHKWIICLIITSLLSYRLSLLICIADVLEIVIQDQLGTILQLNVLTRHAECVFAEWIATVVVTTAVYS